MLKVEIEKFDCILSKRATRPYIWSYKCECVRTYLCIDLAECLSPTAISGHTKAEILYAIPRSLICHE